MFLQNVLHPSVLLVILYNVHSTEQPPPPPLKLSTGRLYTVNADCDWLGSAGGMYSGRWSGAGNFDQVRGWRNNCDTHNTFSLIDLKKCIISAKNISNSSA